MGSPAVRFPNPEKSGRFRPTARVGAPFMVALGVAVVNVAIRTDPLFALVDPFSVAYRRSDCADAENA
ncbi:hypothetical protein AB0B25_09680 [Nocardia sp. NPDC049190]|uniref:hypothetical protein n=1 Tax=Nocardia sp. NPDC049190 TaxID=3155650 RepID=UPI0034109408